MKAVLVVWIAAVVLAAEPAAVEANTSETTLARVSAYSDEVRDPTASAVDLGVGIALLLSSLISGPEGDVMQMYNMAREPGAELGLMVPMPPMGELENRMAEGLKYSIDTGKNVGQFLAEEHGSRVAAAFAFSFSVLVANTFAEDRSLREPLVNNAIAAADRLNLPVEFMQRVLQTIESRQPDAGMVLYGEMDTLKALLAD